MAAGHRYDAPGQAVSGKQAKKGTAPIESSIIKVTQQSMCSSVSCFSSPYPKTVSIYDGHQKFQLGNYWDRPYTGKIEKGSTVMLLFSIKKGNLPKSLEEVQGLPAAIKFAIYFNILRIIVLAEPAEQFSEDISEGDPEAFGVNTIIEWPEEEESESESGGEEIEEEFL